MLRSAVSPKTAHQESYDSQMAPQIHGWPSKALNQLTQNGRTQASQLKTHQCSGATSGAERKSHTKHRADFNGSDQTRWVMQAIPNSIIIHNFLVPSVSQGRMEFRRTSWAIAGSWQPLHPYRRYPKESTGSSGIRTITQKEHSGTTSG